LAVLLQGSEIISCRRRGGSLASVDDLDDEAVALLRRAHDAGL